MKRTPAAGRPGSTFLRRLGAASLFALAGCAVGPDFRQPPPPAVDGYRHDPLPPATVTAAAPTGDAQRFVEAAAAPERWWTRFASAELERRVERALAHSPSVASAQAALRQARENVIAERGSLFPQIDAKPSVTRGNATSAGAFSGSAAGAGVGGGVATSASTYTLYNAGVDVSYTLDLFGGIRRGIEAQSALADYQAFQLEGTYLTLASNVATASFREASLRGQIKANEEIIAAYEQQLKLVETQNEIGAKSLADVLVVRSEIATARAQLPALRQSLAQTQTQLAVYLGEFPSRSDLEAIDLDALTLPPELPVSLPSELVRQRPDIRAAEAQLHEATARVGVATANLFPQITLSGSLGSQALHADDLFSSGTKSWSIIGSLVQPLFHGGTLRADQRASEAGLDKAAADYQTTVLTAFQNVADSLRALELDAENLKAQAEAEHATGGSLDFVRSNYRDGAASYLQVLDATRQYQQARIGTIQARAARLADTAALYVALGGGWQEAATRALAATPNTESR